MFALKILNPSLFSKRIAYAHSFWTETEKLTYLIYLLVMATAEERKLELERKKQKLAEIREEKRRREEERRRNLLKNANLENGTGFFHFYQHYIMQNDFFIAEHMFFVTSYMLLFICSFSSFIFFWILWLNSVWEVAKDRGFL